MKGRVLTGVAERELDRRQFLKAAGAATVLGVAGILGGDLLLGCAPAKAPTPKTAVPAGYENLRMLGGSLGSNSTTAFMAFAAILSNYYPEISWSVVSGGSTTNAIYVTKGTVPLGMTGRSAYLESYGVDKIPESRLRSMSSNGPTSQYVFLIPEDKPWNDLAQVPKGLSLSPGPQSGTVTVACEAMLKLAGLSKNDFKWIPLGKSEMADAWRVGKIDIGFANISGVAPFLMDMHTSPRKFKALGLSPEQVAQAKAEQTFERIGFEPPSMGNLSVLAPEIFKYDVVCPQAAFFLCSRDDFPEDIAYKMAKILDEHNAEVASIYPSLKYATPQEHIKWARPPMDIHPGVAKYYREKGYLK